MPEEASAFFSRLKKAKTRALGEEFSKRITVSERNKIIDYFLHEKEAIAALKAGEACRFDKRKTGLPRTVNILCSPEGELKLIIEFKGKGAEGIKGDFPVLEGSFKKGKLAGRFDSEKEIEYFNLVSIIRSKDDSADLEEEVGLTQMMRSGKIDVLELGEEFTKENKEGISITKRSVYSIKAIGDLFNLLHEDKSALSQKQKNIMILDLLEGLKVIHDKGFVHQDIKPENILVNEDFKNGYRLKIADLGLTTKQGDPSVYAISAAGYHSPEMACYYAKPETFYHEFFKGVRSQVSLGHRYFSSTKDESEFQVPEAEKPDKANDMWSLGLVCGAILYGKQPASIEEMENIDNVLIKGLLNPHRSKRFTVDQAIAATLVNILLQPHHTDKELKRVADLLSNNEEIFNEVKEGVKDKMRGAAREKIVKEIDVLSEKLIKKEGWTERFFRFTQPKYEILQQMKAVLPAPALVEKKEPQQRAQPVLNLFSGTPKTPFNANPSLKEAKDMPAPKDHSDPTRTFKQ